MQRFRLQDKWKRLIEHLWNLRSLKVRLFALILVVGVVPSILMCNVLLSNYEERAVGLRINTVQNQVKILANHLIYENYLQGIVPINVCAHCGPGTIGLMVSKKINGKSIKEYL